MPGGRRIPMTVEADTKGDFDKAADGLDKVAKKADDADGALRKMSKGSQALDAEISKAARSVKDLRAEFERTGDVGLLKDAKKLDNARKGLERLRNEFDLVGQSSADNGKKIGGLGSVITNAMESGVQSAGKAAASNPYIAGGIAAGITLGAPLIGAAASAAVLAGVGGAVIAGGIVAAAKDPAVSAAFSDLTGHVSAEWSQASSVFVQPLIAGAAEVSHAFDRLMPSMRQGMDALAPTVGRLASGVAGLVDGMGPGLNDALRASGPVLDQLAAEMPGLGRDVGTFFSEVSRGGPGAVQFMHDFATATGDVIVATGWVTEHLSKTYHFLRNNQIGKDLLDLIPGGPLLNAWDDFGHRGGKAGQDVKKGLEDAAQGADHAAGSIDKAKKSLSDFVTEALHMQDSELALQKGLFDVAAAFDKNGESLDITTEKGLANREALQHQIETIARWRQEQDAAGKAPAYVNGEVEKQIGLMYADAKAHGANTAQLDALVRQWQTMLNLPAQKNLTTTITTISQRIDNGNIVPGSGGRRAVAHGGMLTPTGIRHAAAGMFIPPSDPGTVLTAEPRTRGEWLIPAQGIQPSRAAMLAQGALSGYGYDVVPRSSGYASPVVARGGGGAGGVTRIEVVLSAAPGDQAAEGLLSMLRPAVRGRYGGDVTAAMGGAG